MEVKLGFGAVPKPQYVFVSKEADHCWYMLAEDENRSVGVSWDGHKELDWQALGQRVSLKINKIYNFNQYKNQSQSEASDNIKTPEPRDVFIAKTDTYLAQLNWSPEQGREYLQQKYGKRSRLQLTDTEILEFIDYLKLQLTQSY